jgi:hypothetical protein
MNYLTEEKTIPYSKLSIPVEIPSPALMGFCGTGFLFLREVFSCFVGQFFSKYFSIHTKKLPNMKLKNMKKN